MSQCHFAIFRNIASSCIRTTVKHSLFHFFQIFFLHFHGSVKITESSDSTHIFSPFFVLRSFISRFELLIFTGLSVFFDHTHQIIHPLPINNFLTINICCFSRILPHLICVLRVVQHGLQVFFHFLHVINRGQ